MPVELFGVRTFVASVEDTILSKLESSRMSGSDQQLRDVNGIVSIQRPTLDLEYLERWATELGIIDELHTALSPDA